MDSEARLRKVQGVPIEIALPPKLDDFLRHRPLLFDVTRQLKSFNIPVRSVHAPHGPIADDAFRNWAPSVIGFAEAVGAEIAVFHPEVRSTESRKNGQSTAIVNLKHVQDRTRVTVSIETFWGEDHVLTPDDIMENHLPMVLDTSLVPKPEITWILESYHTHVVNLHLSAVAADADHTAARLFRPVDSDPFCLDILDRFHELGWNGVVTLEYLPWLSNKSMEDRLLLERIYHQYQGAQDPAQPDLQT
jgi:sugar phosphate isomerase/epimerase